MQRSRRLITQLRDLFPFRELHAGASEATRTGAHAQMMIESAALGKAIEAFRLAARSKPAMDREQHDLQLDLAIRAMRKSDFRSPNA
jgi:hypothetical protein